MFFVRFSISIKSPKSKPCEFSLSENILLGLGTSFKKFLPERFLVAISTGFLTTSFTGISFDRYLFTKELLAPFSKSLLTR